MEELSMTAGKDLGNLARLRLLKMRMLNLGSKEVYNIMCQLRKDNIIEIELNFAINVIDLDIQQGNANSD